MALVVALGRTRVGGLRDGRHQHAEEAQEAQNQLFVDTASQFVVNMFSYTQQSIDEDVDRFVNNTSGPLRDMMSQGQNTENLKLLFRDTNASAEAVINGAALEKLDKVADRADVLVAVRVTVTDLDGNNAPSKPYRLRVTVAEDDNGHMSFYDLKYPDGATDVIEGGETGRRAVDPAGVRLRRAGRRRGLVLLDRRRDPG